MSLENEIAILEQVTNDLLDAVNTNKTKLDTAVTNAEAAVSTATTQVNLVTAEKLSAQIASDETESHKDLAYGYSQSAASAVAYQDLTAIAQTKAETAVDVFVYDTSKDSDGGAWRQRTQGTSWYNETLNTATRGSRKEFPAVAVIVAESGKVTIYDGDDPSMPMWMVFNGSYNNMLGLGGSYSFVSVAALNGKITPCSYDGAMGGLKIIDFVADKGNRVGTSTSSPVTGRYNGGISQRDDALSVSYVTGDYSNTIVNNKVNNVAMTVLPNAPIDPVTGLPIPTIAVATDGGVSVIKDDGTVVDITDSAGTSPFTRVVFLPDNKILFTLWNGYTSLVYGIPDEDILGISNSSTGNALEGYHSYYYTNPDLYLSDFYHVRVYRVVSMNKDLAYGMQIKLYADHSLVLLNRNIPDPAKGMLSYITSNYNTGWMNGDIKLATLSDTDDTDLVGSELVTNGTFDTDISGWSSANGATISYDNSTINIQTIEYEGAAQSMTVEVGKSYTVSFDVTATTVSSARIYIGTSAQAGKYLNNSGFSVGSHTFTMTSTATELRISLATTAASGNVNFDNISVRPASADRSVNNNGLQVFGTVTREPVATGADLVAYLPWGGGWLKQPYNPDLDFGTGDFCVMSWVKNTDTERSGYLFDFSSDTGSSRSYCIFAKNYINTSNGTITPTIPYVANTWTLVGLKRKDGVLTAIVNDNEYIVTSNSTGSFGCSSPDVKLHLSRYTRGEAFEKISLFRISATAPTADQIEKIYNDEKVLFQENAKATLYGTSDTVTALAYDEDTDLLHVGTSKGRSVFQGLERVDNTTDAVGVAISAVNGLVVEE